MADATPKKTDKIMTPANIVTLVRICLVPVFVVAVLAPWPEWTGLSQLNVWKPWIAALIFVVISGTDWLDGYLARSRNEVTDFGKFMDPLADKILVIAALLALVELGSLPSWPVLIIAAREFIISGVRMMAASKGEVIAASWYGKFKTVFTMIAIVMFVVNDSALIHGFSEQVATGFFYLSWFIMAIALVLTIVSMMDYVSKARHLIGFRPKNASVEEAQNVVQDERSAAERVIDAAKQADKRIGTAESCTGGLIAASLTDVPGSSEVVYGGIVSYANEVKQARLGVKAETLQKFGAVSEETAREMAKGALGALGVDVAVSVTGIAGPGGAVPGKPVGTVWIAVATMDGVEAHLHSFDGDREAVRAQTVDAALGLMLEALER